ncbi:Uncharacterized protein Y057_8994 [Fusarium fujikuroi]|nr:Uncharacterized protein Y057_8994 [Fusarium fujikuroi]
MGLPDTKNPEEPFLANHYILCLWSEIKEKSAPIEDDIAFEGDVSPMIDKSSPGVTKNITEDPTKRSGGGPPE